jgi:hypothetical protein
VSHIALTPFKGARIENWSATRNCGVVSLLSLSMLLVACGPVHNNNLQVNTTLAKIVHGGTTFTPLGSQPIAGQWVSDIPVNSSDNPNHITAAGTLKSFSGATSPFNSIDAGLGYWPTEYTASNARMPGYWDFQWSHPSNCIDIDQTSYPLLANPAVFTNEVELPTSSKTVGPQRDFNCYLNTPNNPDFSPSEVSQQVALDDSFPTSIQVAAFSPINAAASITHLRLLPHRLQIQ